MLLLLKAYSFEKVAFNSFWMSMMEQICTFSLMSSIFIFPSLSFCRTATHWICFCRCSCLERMSSFCYCCLLVTFLFLFIFPSISLCFGFVSDSPSESLSRTEFPKSVPILLWRFPFSFSTKLNLSHCHIHNIYFSSEHDLFLLHFRYLWYSLSFQFGSRNLFSLSISTFVSVS